MPRGDSARMQQPVSVSALSAFWGGPGGVLLLLCVVRKRRWRAVGRKPPVVVVHCAQEQFGGEGGESWEVARSQMTMWPIVRRFAAARGPLVCCLGGIRGERGRERAGGGKERRPVAAGGGYAAAAMPRGARFAPKNRARRPGAPAWRAARSRGKGDAAGRHSVTSARFPPKSRAPGAHLVRRFPLPPPSVGAGGDD